MCLPFQIVEDEVLCVHGGLSPYIKSLDQIRVIDRNQEIPHQGGQQRCMLRMGSKAWSEVPSQITDKSEYERPAVATL